MQRESNETPLCDGVIVIILLKYRLSTGRLGGRPSRSRQWLWRCASEEILHVLPVGLFRAIFPGKQILLSAIYHTCYVTYASSRARQTRKRFLLIPPSPLCVHLSVFSLIRAYLLSGGQLRPTWISQAWEVFQLVNKSIYDLNCDY